MGLMKVVYIIKGWAMKDELEQIRRNTQITMRGINNLLRERKESVGMANSTFYLEEAKDNLYKAKYMIDEALCEVEEEGL